MHKKLAILNEFDDNVAVVATTVVRITGIILSSFHQNNGRGGRWFKFGSVCVTAGRVHGTSGGSGRAPAPAAAVASVFQLPSHR